MSASARDGKGENSSENWTSPEFFSPIFSLGPSRIHRCTVVRVQTKTRISPSEKIDELYIQKWCAYGEPGVKKCKKCMLECACNPLY